MASLPFELKGKTVYVAGHRGMVGSALVRRRLDVIRLARLGCRASRPLEDGISHAYEVYRTKTVD
jgi:nucleoside-diphosphate-sugar epimerase